MIATLDQRSSFVAAAEYLIAKHAPRLMRTGGGAISGENPAGVSLPITEKEVANFRALFAAGKTVKEISANTGRSIDAVVRWTRDIRPMGRRGRPAPITPIKAKVISLLGTSENFADIARKAGTTRCYVRQISLELKQRAAK